MSKVMIARTMTATATMRRAFTLSVITMICLGQQGGVQAQELGNITTTTTIASNSTNNTIPECFSTLKSINEAMEAKDPYRRVEYTLCPNTVFSVGFNRGIDGFVNGDEPLQPRSNSVIRCGESGSSRNNCTIRGGDAHTQLFDAHHPEASRDDIKIEGVTYESIKTARVAVVIAIGGYVKFHDCVFKGHVNAQIVAVLYQPRGSGRGFLEVTFDSCVFESNSLFYGGSVMGSSLIGSDSAFTTLIVRNSIFANNDLKDEEFRKSDVIEIKSGGSLKLENNCFLNNKVVGDGVVSVGDNGDIIIARGNYGTRVEGARCDFLVLERESSCTNYDFPQCVLDFTDGVLTPPLPGFVPEVPLPTASPTRDDTLATATLSSSGNRWPIAGQFLVLLFLLSW